MKRIAKLTHNESDIRAWAHMWFLILTLKRTHPRNPFRNPSQRRKRRPIDFAVKNGGAFLNARSHIIGFNTSRI